MLRRQLSQSFAKNLIEGHPSVLAGPKFFKAELEIPADFFVRTGITLQTFHE